MGSQRSAAGSVPVPITRGVLWYFRTAIQPQEVAWFLLVLCIAAAVSWVAYASGGSVYVISTNRVNNQTASWFRFEPAASASSSWVTTWQEIAKNSDGTASTTVENGYTSWWNGYGWATPFQHTIGLNHLPTQDLFLTTNPTGDHVLVGLDTNMEV